MFKVLGQDTSIVKLGDDWKERMLELAGEGPRREKLVELFAAAEFTYFYGTEQDVHAFILQLPEETTEDEVQSYISTVREVRSFTDYPMVSFNDKPQRCKLVITAETEPELLGKDRTEGYGSGKLFQPIFNSWSDSRKPF